MKPPWRRLCKLSNVEAKSGTREAKRLGLALCRICVGNNQGMPIYIRAWLEKHSALFVGCSRAQGNQGAELVLSNSLVNLRQSGPQGMKLDMRAHIFCCSGQR